VRLSLKPLFSSMNCDQLGEELRIEQGLDRDVAEDALTLESALSRLSTCTLLTSSTLSMRGIMPEPSATGR